MSQRHSHMFLIRICSAFAFRMSKRAILLFCLSASVVATFELINKRILVNSYENVVVISKHSQCINAVWNFTIDSESTLASFERLVQRFCGRISAYEKFRKEIETSRSVRKYEFATETMAITCALDAETSKLDFWQQLEDMFYFNKFTNVHSAAPQALITASKLPENWDWTSSFVSEQMRPRVLYCDDSGVTIEICVPQVHEGMFGEMYQAVDIGAFSADSQQFEFVQIPNMVYNKFSQPTFHGFENQTCYFGGNKTYSCPLSALTLCDVTNFEDCQLQTLVVDTNFTFVRIYNDYYLVATTEQEFAINSDVQDVPAPIFLIAVALNDVVKIGDEILRNDGMNTFDKTVIKRIEEKAPATTSPPKSKGFFQQIFGFFG